MGRFALYFVSILLVISLVGTTPGLRAGSQINVTKVIFVDYDGDGFDDLAADNNENGIPDYIEETKDEPIVEVESILGDSFGEQIKPAEEMYLDNQEAFSARDFSVRCLTGRRIGLNAGEDFGAGNGLNVGGTGGGCQGGACR